MQVVNHCMINQKLIVLWMLSMKQKVAIALGLQRGFSSCCSIRKSGAAAEERWMAAELTVRLQG